MAVITINLGDEQMTRAHAILRKLRDQHGEGVTRSEVFRIAIDSLFLTVCPTDTTEDTSVDRPAEDIAA